MDSSVLLKLAADCLGRDQILAATVYSELSTPQELKTAEQIAELCQVEHQIVYRSELAIPEIAANSRNAVTTASITAFNCCRNWRLNAAFPRWSTVPTSRTRETTGRG